MRNPLQQFALSQLAGIQQSLAEAADAADRELRATKVEAVAGGGAVRVTANGLGELIEVKLDPSVLSNEPDAITLLEDLIATAVRDVMARAAEKTSEIRREKMKESGPFSLLEQFGINLDSVGQ
jgi:nucleoid-associated protein EbfC